MVCEIRQRLFAAPGCASVNTQPLFPLIQKPSSSSGLAIARPRAAVRDAATARHRPPQRELRFCGSHDPQRHGAVLAEVPQQHAAAVQAEAAGVAHVGSIVARLRIIAEQRLRALQHFGSPRARQEQRHRALRQADPARRRQVHAHGVALAFASTGTERRCDPSAAAAAAAELGVHLRELGPGQCRGGDGSSINHSLEIRSLARRARWS